MKKIVGTLCLLLRWISLAKCDLTFADKNDEIWPPRRLLVMTDDHELLEENGFAAEQPAGFECTQKEHVKSILGGTAPKCGCPKRNKQCAMRCRKLNMLVQVKGALGNDLGALESFEKFQGNHMNRLRGGNVAETFHFSYKQKVTATFDSNLRLHGLFKVSYLTHIEFRIFEHGKEIGPFIIFLGKSVSFKHNKKEILILKSNQWLTTKKEAASEETCQPLILRFNEDQNKDWTLHRLETPLTQPRSLSALFNIVTDMPKHFEDAIIDFEVPTHLQEDMRTAQEVETAIIGLHSVHCVNGRYKPLKRYSASNTSIYHVMLSMKMTFSLLFQFCGVPTTVGFECGES